MGALPSRESHEGPNTVYFGNNTGVVTFRLPLTPHYFPSADCLGFKEVHRVRDSQSCKYSFNIREAFALLPETAAQDFQAAQKVGWGPEADAVDPSVHYRDDEVVDRLADHGLGCHTAAAATTTPNDKADKHRHLRRSIDTREELYQKLVIDPTTNALVDTDDEMCELFLAEQRWRAARDLVCRHRAYLRQQKMSDAERSQLDADARVDVDVEAGALEKAEAVPPPAKWLRPIPEVVVERMSMEDTCAAHRAYRERHAARLSDSAESPEQQHPHHASGGTKLDRRQTLCSLHREQARRHGGGDAVALNVLDTHGRQPFVESETLNEEVLKSYPGFQDEPLPFELDEQYMDGRVHMVPYEGVNYLFAYNPAYVRKMGKTVAVDGSLAEERRRRCGAAQSEHSRAPFTTTHLVATRQAEDFDDPNQRRAYEIFQPVYERYYIPVMPVRVLGVDGFIPCNTATAAAEGGSTKSTGSSDLRAAPWMRGVENDAEEEAYQEETLWQRYGVPPPPVLRACRFIHAMIGDKILNRTSVLGCMTFRERCLNAGLPDAIACPLWAVMELSDTPQLQFQREIELRLLAALHEIDDGDMRIRNALARQHKWNDYVKFTNSPMYGFMVSAPPERRFRVGVNGKLKEVGADDDDAESCGSSSGNDKDKDEENGGRQAQQRRVKKVIRTTDTSTFPFIVKEEVMSVDMSLHSGRSGSGGAGMDASGVDGNSSSSTAKTSVSAALHLRLPGTTSSSSPSSDTESRDEQHSGSTSARSAAHNTSIRIVEHGENAAKDNAASAPTRSAAAATTAGTAARVKRTREGQTCIGGYAPPETAEQSAALETAMTNAGISQSCAAAVTASDDDLLGLAAPPVYLHCAWSFKRRRLSELEEVVVNPNFSEEDWMPMVNPLTKDTALAELGVRVSLRGRLALARYSASAMRNIVYYLSQASAPIFCLPYVGPPQQCPNVYFESVLRAPSPTAATSAQNGLQPPTAEQVRTAIAAYQEGRVSCYVFSNLNDRAANPPTSGAANHRRDAVLMDEPLQVGVTSKLILAQLPIKADARCVLEWYRTSLAHGAASVSGDEPYATWPALLDAPAPCDGDVLVVCPRTHRWIRATTLVLLTTLLVAHRKVRQKDEELPDPVPVLSLYMDDHFATEVGVCYDALTHKNTDSEGMQWYSINMRNSFSYNGIVELVLDRLRAIVDLEGYEDKDDEGWLVLHDPAVPGHSTTANGTPSPLSTPTAATSGSVSLTSQKYMESGSYFIWSFMMAGQRFFLGTKPRFIRLALQRQKQNQRRRQKRKGRDAPTIAATATGNEVADTANTNAITAAAEGDVRIRTGAPSQATATVAAASSHPGVAAGASAHAVHSGSAASFGSGGSTTTSSAGTGHFTPQTSFSAVPPPTFTGLPISETDRMQLVHAPQQQQQQQHTRPERHRGSGLTTHVPYAPLRLSSDNRGVFEECNEMKECRQLHTQWIESRGLLITSAVAREGLPLSPNVDTARWELPPLAGQLGCRRRLVVPIAPHGMGKPRFVDCAELGCAVAENPPRGASPSSSGAEARGEQRMARSENEEAEVPEQRPASPRVVDAEHGSFRWDPYRVRE